MLKLILDEMEKAEDWYEEDDYALSYHMGKAGGIAAATRVPGFYYEWLCDEISSDYEMLDLDEEDVDEGDLDDEEFEEAVERVRNQELNFRRIIEDLTKSVEDGRSGEASEHPVMGWEEYGVALNEAMAFRGVGFGNRYHLMMGFVAGLMFQDPGPRYDGGSILDAIQEGYRQGDMNRLDWAKARLATGHRMSDPSPFMKKESYDRYMEGKLRTMRWIQNFGLHAARKDDERVAVPTSMSINHALRQMKSSEE